jgi:hypothetical protein
MGLTKKILPLAAVLAVALPASSAMAAPKSKFRFAQPTYVTKEGDAVQVTVTRTARHGNSRVNQASSVNWAITGGTATEGTDYDTDIAQGKLSFAAGETTKTITFTTHQDTDIEGLETIGLKLSAASRNALITSPRTAQVLIADDDGPTQIELAPASQSVSEAAGAATLFAVRSGDITGDSAVDYTTSDDTATAGSDYSATSGHFDFHLGDFSQTITVPIADDSAIENPETFDVSLSNVTGATPGNANGTVTIVDNDSSPVFALDASSYEVNENGSVDVTVQRLGNTDAPGVSANAVFDVTWGTTDGTATNPADYLPSDDRQLEFDASDDAETITIAANDADTQIGLVDDTLVEGDETFGLALLSADNSSSIGSPSSATVTIHDNDSPATGSEPGTGSGAGAGTSTGGDSQLVFGARQAGCSLTAKAVKAQKLLKQKALKLTLRVGQACKVTLATTVNQLKSKKKTVRSAKALPFKGKNSSLTLQPGKAKTVKVTFTKKTLKAIKKALRARKKLVATVVVTSKDSASKLTRKTVKITIKG